MFEFVQINKSLIVIFNFILEEVHFIKYSWSSSWPFVGADRINALTAAFFKSLLKHRRGQYAFGIASSITSYA